MNDFLFKVPRSTDDGKTCKVKALKAHWRESDQNRLLIAQIDMTCY